MAKAPFQRRCDMGTVAMNLEVIRKMSDQAIGTLASCCHCAPRLGEHVYDVLEELLGISGVHLAALKEDGIV